MLLKCMSLSIVAHIMFLFSVSVLADCGEMNESEERQCVRGLVDCLNCDCMPKALKFKQFCFLWNKSDSEKLFLDQNFLNSLLN